MPKIDPSRLKIVSPTIAKVPAIIRPTLSLPTEFSEPCANFQDYSSLWYSEPKGGKTSLAAEFPDNFFMMFEPGAKAIRVKQRPIREWEEAQGYAELLKTDKNFRTVTLDTIDEAYKMCLAFVCKRDGFDHPADEGHGKGWNRVSTEFGTWLNKVLSLGKGCILTSHAQEKEITSRLQEKYTRIVPTMSGQARNIVEALVDIWAYIYFKNGRRVMRIRGNDLIAAGHRLQDNFLDIEEIEMGEDAKEAYKNLMDAFNNKLSTKPAAPAPGKPAGPKMLSIGGK